jgi:hypothetical protein
MPLGFFFLVEINILSLLIFQVSKRFSKSAYLINSTFVFTGPYISFYLYFLDPWRFVELFLEFFDLICWKDESWDSYSSVSYFHWSNFLWNCSDFRDYDFVSKSCERFIYYFLDVSSWSFFLKLKIL